jgi:NAD(P)-dependent dehydrogenase (short-subunit alcohol dehydrogenase family)
MALDVTDPHEIESVAKEFVAPGGVDVVFNNAGYGLAVRSKGLLTTKFSAWSTPTC